jgi:biopolymer transport protein ExbD
MSNATASAHTAGMSDINITPLIDVMLVVLVIFMIAIPAITRTIPAELPGYSPNTPTPQQSMLLRIGGDGSYSLDGQPVTRISLPGLLGNTTAMIEGKAPTLKVQIDDHARYETVAQALAVARNAGIDRIVMVR